MHKFFCVFLLFFSFEIYSQPVPPGAVLEKIRTGFLQPEGPVWMDSLGILFSDIQANKIYRWSPWEDSLTTFLFPSDSSNGLTLDLQGRLILTQMAKRRVSRRESNGTITVLASTYGGKKLNSPNDVIVKSDGTIFFTDPDFNIPVGQTKELTFQGIYRIDTTGNLKLLDKTLNKPNGICFSPDELKMYVDESAKDSIYVWDVISKDSIANKRGFYHIPRTGYADGMKVDPDGNLYCTGPLGIWIISPSGILLDTILLPNGAGASNCNWGDADGKTLYITEGSQNNKSLFRIRLALTEDVKDHGYLPLDPIELFPNYPNPFNPATKISFHLGTYNYTSLRVYDILGREIITLVDGIQTAGKHTVEWDGKNSAGQTIPSGIYFYQLKTGPFSQTKKMILSK